MNERTRQFINQALADPAWLFYEFDLHADKAGFVRVTEDNYRHAAFLDQRLQLRNPKQAVIHLSALQATYGRLAPAPRPGHFLFHVGHCGSTLVSRLLGEMAPVFAVREPLPLGILSMLWREQGNADSFLNLDDYERLEGLVFHLLKRVFQPDQVPVVKATSICGNLAQRVLANHPDTRIVLMYVNLDVFLAGMLRNRVRREETNAAGQTNLHDLRRHLDTDQVRGDGLNQSRRTAVNWLAKMTAFAGLMDGEFAPRCLLLDFEQFLRHPQKELAQVAAHFGFKTDPDLLQRLVDGSIMRSYAKDSNTAFGPEDRRQELAHARHEHNDEIHAGLAWAGELVRHYPALEPLRSYLGTTY